MTHDIQPDEARRLLDADRERASREARLKLAREWWKASDTAHRVEQSHVDFGQQFNSATAVYTPFGEFTVAELEGA